jgi:hypothetical protein
MKLSRVCISVFFLSTFATVDAAERVSCTEGEALQEIARGRPADSIRHWDSLDQAQKAFRLDVLRLWGLRSANEKTCEVFAECTSSFIVLQLNSLKACSDSGEEGASILLGTIALTDAWGKKDIAVAQAEFQKARRAKSGLAQLGRAVVAKLRGDNVTARKFAAKAIARGAEVDDYLVGYLFKNGLLFPQDYREAAYWFARGAESNDWRAQAALAYMYTTGSGVDRNPQKAAELLRAVERNPASHSETDVRSVITDVKSQ